MNAAPRRRPTRRIATALCDCGWTDVADGCQGRAALHHDRTGHEVRVDIVIRYGTAGPPAGQLELEETHGDQPDRA